MSKLGRLGTEKTRQIVEKIRSVESPAALSFALSQQSLIQEKGEGMYVTDVDGNRYLDFMSGFGALSTGHSHPRVVEAVREQSGKIVHAMASSSSVRAALLERIASLTPGPPNDKAIQLCIGGSDAMEVAIKQARFHKQKAGMIAFEGGFHGRTTGALALTAFGISRRGIGPLFPGVTHVPYPYCYRCAFGLTYPGCNLHCVLYLDRKLSARYSGVSEVGSIFVEPIQGVGGMVVPPIEFLKELRHICDRYELVLVADEVMSGWGRTGKLFACEHSGVIPDILVTAKGIASGYPLSAVVSRKAVLTNWQPSTEGYTFAGNLVSCAAGLATIAVIEEQDLAGNATQMGGYFADNLQELQKCHTFIGEVRHRGLMVAMELVKDRTTKQPLPAAEVIESLMDEGLLAYLGGYHRNVVAFLPPLICVKKDIDEAMNILKSVFSNVKA